MMSVIDEYNELKGLVKECVHEEMEQAQRQEKEKAEKAAEEMKKTVSDIVEEKIKKYGIQR